MLIISLALSALINNVNISYASDFSNYTEVYNMNRIASTGDAKYRVRFRATHLYYDQENYHPSVIGQTHTINLSGDAQESVQYTVEPNGTTSHIFSLSINGQYTVQVYLGSTLKLHCVKEADKNVFSCTKNPSDLPTMPFDPADPGAANVPVNSFYDANRDVVRVDYHGWPTDTAYYRLVNETDSGMIYDRFYEYSPTGIHYLTCNASNYSFEFYNASGNKIGYTDVIRVNNLQNPTCSSYAGETIKNDLNASWTPNGDGTFQINFNSSTGKSFELYKDGQYMGTYPQSPINVPGEGSYTIIAKDQNGNIVGESDLNVRSGTGNNGGSCNVCEKLSEILSCPAWNDYMGEWQQLLESVIPPPPDWQSVSEIFANTFVGAFDNYMGDMPTPPTTQQISQKLPNIPTVDSSFPEAENLTPQAPQFDEPFNFDITDGPQIEIIDESEPFEIFEPLHNLDTSGIGVPVIPGDPTNHAGGIEQPGTIETENPLPKPFTNPAPVVEIPIPQTPPQQIPIPGQNANSPPIPTPTTGDIPIHK